MGKAFVDFRAGRKKPWRVRWRERVGNSLRDREASFADGLSAGAARVLHEAEDGQHQELAMSSTDRARWWRIREDCAAAGVTPEQVLVAGLAALGGVGRRNEEIGTAIELFELDARDRALRSDSIKNVVFFARALAGEQRERAVRSFTVSEILGWVAARYAAQSSRDTALGKLLTFFRWCASEPRLWCEAAAFAEVRWPNRARSDKKRVPYYTAEEMRAYLEATPDRAKVAVATGFLLGVRPFELCRLRVRVEIDREVFGFDEKKGHWRIAAGWSKARAFRLLYDLPDAWHYWWLRYAAAIVPRDRRGRKRFAGMVVPMHYRNFRRLLREARARANLRQIKDGFRHSFATHGYHRTQDGKRGVEWCLAMVGHRGRLTTFAAHYDGRVDSHEAEDYFLSYPNGAACEIATRARTIWGAPEIPPRSS